MILCVEIDYKDPRSVAVFWLSCSVAEFAISAYCYITFIVHVVQCGS